MLAQGRAALEVVSSARVVIASERLSICQVLAACLADAGHRVTMLRSGLAVLDELDGPPVDAFILCTSLSFSVDELCRSIRARSHARIVVVALTAGTGDVVAAFKAGVDDFLVGSPEPEELRRRVEALIQAAGRLGELAGEGAAPEGRAARLLGPSGLVVNVLAHEVLAGEKPIELTPKEFAVLRLLVERRGQVVTGDELAEGAWGHLTFGQRNFVEAQISRLRQKLRAAGLEVITTVRGVGYKIA